MRRFTGNVLLLGIALVLAMSVGASAGTIIVQDTTGMLATDWLRPDPDPISSQPPLSVAKFDGSLGTLLSVSVTFESEYNAEVRYENRNAKAQNVTVQIDGTVSLQSIGLSSLSQVQTYNWSTTKSVGAFDGHDDWGGTSGAILPKVTDSKSTGPIVLTDAASLAYFTGLSTDKSYFSTQATFFSRAPNSARVTTWFDTNALSRVKVVYAFVPEPSGVLALASGFIGLIGVVLKKRY